MEPAEGPFPLDSTQPLQSEGPGKQLTVWDIVLPRSEPEALYPVCVKVRKSIANEFLFIFKFWKELETCMAF